MAEADVSITFLNGDAGKLQEGHSLPDGLPPLFEQPILTPRPVRVICVGAGFSGICTGVQISQNATECELQIYERADNVGGVWHHNRYPGVACDVPSHSYQFSFCEDTRWTSYYAPGAEIQQYLQNVAEVYGVVDKIKFKHEVVGAKWFDDEGCWEVRVKDLISGNEFTDRAEFFVYATGLLSKPVWPKIKGLSSFNGEKRHSGMWDIAKDEGSPGWSWKDKRVGVIGNGASGVQIVPYLQKRAHEVVNFGRSKIWISSGFGSKVLETLQPGSSDGRNHTFTPIELEMLDDPGEYRRFRREIEADLSSSHQITLTGHPLQRAFREKLSDLMTEQCSGKPDIGAALIPDFPVGCRRLTPGPGYLPALLSDNCNLEPDDIDEITPTGLRTVSGREYELDMIVCATGYDSTLIPSFPIIGAKGVNLQDQWAEEPTSYLGISVPNMPNFFNLLVAQSLISSGSLLVVLEAQVAYMLEAVAKCQRDGYKSFSPKQQAVDDFGRYTDDYFARTVYTANCRSWFKAGKDGAAKIRTLWPGSGPHCFLAMKHPKWEDYDWTRKESHAHSMSWLGNGQIPACWDGHVIHDEARKYYKDRWLLLLDGSAIRTDL